MEIVEKILSKNDTGETGSHQAGIAIPLKGPFLSFFPSLDTNAFNPDCWLTCEDEQGESWEMRFIYYNGKTFTPRKSSRNEYRISHMTSFLKRWKAKAGDSIRFVTTDDPSHFRVFIIKASDASSRQDDEILEHGKTVVRLRGWKAVF